MKENYFLDLSKVDVTKHVEKKGAFSYLSWPFAVSQLRQFDPTATWEVKRFGGLPYLACELGVFVEVAVTVQGTTLSQIHPVLDGKNRPIVAPTSFDINTSIQRCLVKAIALHGLGLTVYAGEDLPLIDEPADKPAPAATTQIAPVHASRSDVITTAQARYINKLIVETGTELQKVLDYFGLDTIESIAKADASRVIRSLEQARSRKEAA